MLTGRGGRGRIGLKVLFNQVLPMLQVKIVMDFLQPHVIAVVANSGDSGVLLAGLPVLEWETGDVGVLLHQLLLHGPLLLLLHRLPVLRIVLRLSTQHHQRLILLQPLILRLPLQSLCPLPLELLLQAVTMTEPVLRVGSACLVGAVDGLLAVTAAIADPL